jgi:hypothetical protein
MIGVILLDFGLPPSFPFLLDAADLSLDLDLPPTFPPSDPSATACGFLDSFIESKVVWVSVQMISFEGHQVMLASRCRVSWCAA